MSLLCDVCGVSGTTADRSSADEVWVCPLCEFSALTPDDRSVKEEPERPPARPSNRLLFAPAQKDQKTVKGTVVWIAQGAQGIDGWKAGKIRTREETVKFVGPCSVKVGDSVRLHGTWEEDKKYGRQYRVQYATAAIGTDVEAIRKLVEVDASFRQIGPRRAGYIADYLNETGLDLEEILEDPETLADLKQYARLPDEAVECLTKSWAERREENLAKAELIQMGVPTRAIETIWRSYGLLSAAAVRDNPYSLTETLDGFGIKEADKIAIGGLKLDRADQRRLVCGVTQAMRRLVIFRGHTWIALRKLTSLTVTELEIGRSGDHRKTAAALEDMIARGRLLTTQVGGIDDLVVCEPKIHADENKFMRTFSPQAKLEPNPHFVEKPLDPEWKTRVGSFVPNEKQIEAVEAFTKHRFLALTGAAGCGKSATVTMLLSICAERSLRVALGAPTGKAAKRLSDLVDKAKITGAPTPMTIHKMLGYQGDRWTYNEKQKLPADVVIVDESSMIDLPLMARLIDALEPKACVILVGDHNQLPPVGPGAVLRDVIEGELCHVVRLVDVLRQAGALRRNATEVLRGVMTPTTVDEKLNTVTWAVEDWHKDATQARAAIVARYRQLLHELGERGFLEVQVLSPMYDGEVGIDALNQSLRSVAHEILYGSDCDPDKAITVGDKVIQTKNDYTVGLMNGDQGVVVSTNGFMGEKRWEAGWIVQVQKGTTQEEVKVPLSRTEGFLLAYAISVHRFQGSEAEHVIGAVHSEHHMLNRKLIYTMATRASRTLLLVGDRKGLHDGTRKDDTSYRRTLTAPSWLIERVAKDPSIV